MHYSQYKINSKTAQSTHSLSAPFQSGRWYGVESTLLNVVVSKQLTFTVMQNKFHTQSTYLLPTSSKKSVTVFSCLLQKSFWKLFFIQSSMLHTLTLSEYQQMDKYFKAGPRRKLRFCSSTGELKFSKDQSTGSWNTSSNLWHVFAKLFLLFLSRKEKRCRRHSRFSWVMCIALAACSGADSLLALEWWQCWKALGTPECCCSYMVVEWCLFLANNWCRS